ncbi:hypothetical protein ACJJTC_002180 [Scirpophaga incertulas]
MSSDDGKSSAELSKKTVGELKRLRGTLKSRITLLQKFVVKIDSDSLTPLQITELEIRLQSAKDTFNEFNNIQNKIELLVEESELDEHLEYRDIFESLYYSVSAVVQQLIKPVKDSESSGYIIYAHSDDVDERVTPICRIVRIQKLDDQQPSSSYLRLIPQLRKGQYSRL